MLRTLNRLLDAAIIIVFTATAFGTSAMMGASLGGSELWAMGGIACGLATAAIR